MEQQPAVVTDNMAMHAKTLMEVLQAIVDDYTLMKQLEVERAREEYAIYIGDQDVKDRYDLLNAQLHALNLTSSHIHYAIESMNDCDVA